jgi:hypothetical protein
VLSDAMFYTGIVQFLDFLPVFTFLQSTLQTFFASLHLVLKTQFLKKSEQKPPASFVNGTILH